MTSSQSVGCVSIVAMGRPMGLMSEYQGIRTGIVGCVQMGVHDDGSQSLGRDGNLRSLAMKEIKSMRTSSSNWHRRIPGR